MRLSMRRQRRRRPMKGECHRKALEDEFGAHERGPDRKRAPAVEAERQTRELSENGITDASPGNVLRR